MNSVHLIGNLARDPEHREIPSQQDKNGNILTVGNIVIAVKKKRGEGAYFIRVATFGKTADNCFKYLNKGSKVGVTGELQTGSYKNKNGETVYTTSVMADSVEFLNSQNKKTEKNKDDTSDIDTEIDMEEIPF